MYETPRTPRRLLGFLSAIFSEACAALTEIGRQHAVTQCWPNPYFCRSVVCPVLCTHMISAEL